jgi:uncharacterized protein YfiM (DUF2279 family)
MKYLTVILLLFTLNISGQNIWLQPDKYMHLTMSAALTALGTETAKDLKLKNPEIVGVTFALSLGLFKEFCYDSKPSAHDLTANIVGSIAGVYVNRLFNKWETKKYYKK